MAADCLRCSADKISDGSLLLSDDACVYQNIAVSTGDELALSCQAQTDGDGYTSLRLAVSDENFSTLDSNEIEIVDTNGNIYATSLTAPNSTSNAVVVLYSEGMAEFDSCVLSINGATHPTTTSTNPQNQLASTLPDTAGPSLLLNGGFESQLQDWQSCNILNTASITSASVSGDAALQLDAPTCLYQLVPLPAAGTAYASCSASNDALKYTSMSLSFSDATFAALGSTSKQISSPGYAPATVSAAIPDTASYAAITLYSEGESRMDDCVLVIDP